MVAGYALLELSLLVLAVPILIAEAAFLLTMLLVRHSDSALPVPIVRDGLPSPSRGAS